MTPKSVGWEDVESDSDDQADDEPGQLGRACPQSKMDYLNLMTGERFPLRCKANGCYVCGPINARLIARAQARSEPSRMFRLSLVPTSWQTARLKIKQVRERLQDLGYRFEWSFSLEPNPSGEDLAHGHGVQHGGFIPQRALQVVCEASGLGIPWIAQIRSEGRTAAYGIKAAGAAFYGVKTATQAQEAAGEYRRFLELNGGRISHHTRGFYRLPDGTPITQGGAISALVDEVRATTAQEGARWQIVEKGLSLQSARVRTLRVLGTRSAGMPV